MYGKRSNANAVRFALGLVLVTAVLGIGIEKASALDNGLALTPPMGWSSWNHFGKGGFTETTIYEIIDAIVASGMRDAGYIYVVVSGGWRDNHLAPRREASSTPDQVSQWNKAIGRLCSC
jgi:alpha-galactosidase